MDVWMVLSTRTLRIDCHQPRTEENKMPFHRLRRTFELIKLVVAGVESVELYPEEKKVAVTGDADPDALLLAVQKIRKEARILTKGSPVSNSSSMADDRGRYSQQNVTKKKTRTADVAAVPAKQEASSKSKAAYKNTKPADELIPMKTAASGKAAAAYTPTEPSNGRDKIASEKEKYSLRLAYGPFEAAVSYSRGKTFENNSEER